MTGQVVVSAPALLAMRFSRPFAATAGVAAEVLQQLDVASGVSDVRVVSLRSDIG
ncbi:hypothetical protein [Leucobacter komagatae]|uniref:hypothetical protein n=1 Tax=Leucobacter komagatae TaxID=55969 RepID=UPI000A604A0E|nr:hypothetical protein [Leucobacter komagatae]